MKNKWIKHLQYNLHSKFVKCRFKTPLIKVAGLALKDRVDLISIMVPYEHGFVFTIGLVILFINMMLLL